MSDGSWRPTSCFLSVQQEYGSWSGLFGYALCCIPDLTPEAALRLELGLDLDDVNKLAVVSVLATV